MASDGRLATGVIYRDENLARMREFSARCVDLIYLDPPFFSNRKYEIIWGDEAELRSFKDRWKGGIDHYVGWMRQRVAEMHRILKDTGSLYLHCDPSASHYLKVMMDGVFEPRNFRAEIIWKRTSAHSDGRQGRRQPGRVHDVLLFYTKSDKWTWNPIYTAYDPEYVEKFYKYVEPETGRRYGLWDVTGPGGEAKGNPQYEVMGVTRYWRYSKEKMEEMVRDGRVVQLKAGSVPRQKRYLDEGKGIPLQDLWTDIHPIGPKAAERQGYPTQKPEALLARIIAASSDNGDVVLDPFCGCGTTVTVAHKMKRKWVGIDISQTAVDIIESRLLKLSAKVEVKGGIQRVEDLRDLEPYEFQNFVIRRVYGTHSSRKTSDLGIDGYSFLEKLPIQVKQSDHVGRNVVDNFETAIRRAEKHKGYILAFSFTRGAYEEAARVGREGLEIALVEIGTLFEVGRDIAPRPAATQMEEDLFQAIRFAAADPSRTGPPPGVSAEELAGSTESPGVERA